MTPRLLHGTFLALASSIPGSAQESADPVDMTSVAQVRDIASNALTLAFRKDGDAVRAALDAIVPECKTTDELVSRLSQRFDVGVREFVAMLYRFRHVNDEGDHFGRAFARDVVFHVFLHELGHALIREFDLPVLGNEETAADAFATHFLVTRHPDEALDVLSARVRSLLVEANDVPRAEWSVQGEHENDARRAYQIAALAVAADRKAYAPLADLVEMSSGQRRQAADYGSEIHRSWRRTLAKLTMPKGVPSTETRLDLRDGEKARRALQADDAYFARIRSCLEQFDWHSQVTFRLQNGDEGGASWSRSRRTITVHEGYVRRFVVQGLRVGDPEATK